MYTAQVDIMWSLEDIFVIIGSHIDISYLWAQANIFNAFFWLTKIFLCPRLHLPGLSFTVLGCILRPLMASLIDFWYKMYPMFPVIVSFISCIHESFVASFILSVSNWYPSFLQLHCILIDIWNYMRVNVPGPNIFQVTFSILIIKWF